MRILRVKIQGGRLGSQQSGGSQQEAESVPRATSPAKKPKLQRKVILRKVILLLQRAGPAPPRVRASSKNAAAVCRRRLPRFACRGFLAGAHPAAKPLNPITQG